ncbi:2-methylcitrate dehydratase [Aurantiacibacter atlanticus]|uniref:2-methylcitrate dehydratase n=1 Tax=Aurantiacibacter atlanticus TaxID=1648404 RepID=A0A0H4VIG0_9SPHN|nr:MmgE/PrpD family protein [Aurantiacibacter atlanticus]AKQ42704.1 2-methylcitrate dehydratase [Aurantiacibacter atlanticus]MDF1834440.1 MmgE/PrpD family protein [Alteraurantiacibacter sp. bin_em_oilr2.035]
MTVAQTLGAFASAESRIDPTMQRFVRFSLFDWITVGIVGVDEPVARAVRKVAIERSGGEGNASLLGGGRTNPAAAALANGATSHALDYDDTHFGHIGHPSVVVIPAALALAEARGAGGGEFMQALAVGLETACRIGAWLGRPHYEAGFHQTGTSGAFGATAAAGRILGLSAGQMAEALSLTATRAAGLKSQFGTMGKPLNAGFAAEVGVTCALLAEAGAASTPMAIEGAQGFGPTHAGVADSEALGGLGAEWVFPRISYKFHACCHGLHAMLEALRKVKARGLEPGAIEAVEIRTHPRWLAVCNQPEPVTGLQAKFSYRLTAAMSLTGLDTSALEVYSDATCARDDLIALRDRVRVVADDSVPDTASEVRVTAADRVLNAGHDVLADSNPDVIEPRLRAKSETLLGGNSSASLWEAVGEIEQQGGMTALTTHIGSAAG